MYKILIADDEAMEREVLTDLVARRFEHEVEIHTADNGRKAVDTALLWGADLILMDIEMPGVNGLEAARTVLARLPGVQGGVCDGLRAVPVRLRGHAPGGLRVYPQAGGARRSRGGHRSEERRVG